MLIISYLDILSPIIKKAKMHVNIGEVKVRVVAKDIGLTFNVRKAKNAEAAAKIIRIRIAPLFSSSIPI